MTTNPPPSLQANDPRVFETRLVDPSLIAPSPTNPRKTFPEASLNEVANSFLEVGQIEPIVLRFLPGDRLGDTFANRGDGEPLPIYELVVGERRWRAAKLVPGFQLRAEIRALTDMEVVRMQIIENLHREEVHPLEEAEGYDYLLHHSTEGITIEQVADEVGKSISYVYCRMKLVALCKPAREAFYAGAFDASTALLIARLPHEQLQEAAIKEIIALSKNGDKPSYRTLRALLASRYHLQLANVVWDIADAKLVPQAGSCTACSKRTGNQPMLFADVESADVCTDPDCFEQKRRAAVAQEVAAARKKGLEVIEGDAAKAIKTHSSDSFLLGHTNINDEAYEDEESGESYSFADLLERMGKRAIKPKLLLDNPASMPTKIISDEEADKLLAKFAPKPKAVPPSGDEAKKQADRRAHRLERETQAAYQRELRQALVDAAEQPRTHEDLALITWALIGSDLDGDVLAEAGVEEEQGDDWTTLEPKLQARLTAMQPQELAAYAMRRAMEHSPPVIVQEAAARSHGIDPQALRTRVAAEVLRAENDEAGAADGAGTDDIDASDQ